MITARLVSSFLKSPGISPFPSILFSMEERMYMPLDRKHQVIIPFVRTSGNMASAQKLMLSGKVRKPHAITALHRIILN